MPTTAHKHSPRAADATHRPLWVSREIKDLVKARSAETGLKMTRLADDILKRALTNPKTCNCQH